MGCKTLTKREITIKTLELIKALGGGTVGIKAIANKCDVTEREVYNWSQYMREDAYPEPDNRTKLLRLYNYHCRNHKGDRKPRKRQEQTHDPSPKEPLEATTRPKNPVRTTKSYRWLRAGIEHDPETYVCKNCSIGKTQDTIHKKGTKIYIEHIGFDKGVKMEIPCI